MEISEILNHLLETHGISEAALSRKTELPRATINRLASGRTPDPRASTLNAIANFFNVSVDQLLGKQPLLANKNENMFSTSARNIPILSLDNAKNWKRHIKEISQNNYYDWLRVESDTESEHFAVRVTGESMVPQFQEKTLLIIDPIKKPHNKDFVVVLIKENKDTVIRQYITEGKYKLLKAINPIFPTITLSEHDAVIGVVIEARSNYV